MNRNSNQSRYPVGQGPKDGQGLRRVSILVVHALVLVLLVVKPVSATVEFETFSDPDDAKGRLDLDEVSQGERGASGEKVLVHRISTFDPWPGRLLGRDATEVDVWFNTEGDERAEFVVYIGHDGARVIASLNRYEDHGDAIGVTFLRWIRASRPNNRSVTIHLPLHEIGTSDTDSYAWQVSTFFLGRRGSKCTEPYRCADWAPSPNDFYTHELREPPP